MFLLYRDIFNICRDDFFRSDRRQEGTLRNAYNIFLATYTMKKALRISSIIFCISKMECFLVRAHTCA